MGDFDRQDERTQSHNADSGRPRLEFQRAAGGGGRSHSAADAYARRLKKRANADDSFLSGFSASNMFDRRISSASSRGNGDPTTAELLKRVEDAGVFLAGAPKHKLSSLQTSINLVKCAVGAGSFSLPFAFFQGGLLVSVVGTLCMGALCAYTVHLLALCERQVLHMMAADRSKGLDIAPPWSPTPQTPRRVAGEEGTPIAGRDGYAFPYRITYPELGARVFPAWAIGSINIMGVVIYAGIVLTSIGVCAAYCDFIAGTMAAVIGDVSPFHFTLFLLPALIGLALLRSFRHLAFTSLLGDVAVTLGIATVSYDAIANGGRGLSLSLPLYKLHTLPQFVAGVAFLFAIQVVILPIMQSMERPRAFARVAYGSFAFISVLNAAFGAVCYMAYREDTRGNVLANLKGGAFLTGVRVLLCVDLLFTLPMVLAAGREIVEEALVPRAAAWWERRRGPMPPAGVEMTRNAIRTAMVGAIVAVVFTVPNFADAVQLIGGFTNCLMGFIVPPSLYLALRSRVAAAAAAAGAGAGAGARAADDAGTSSLLHASPPAPASPAALLPVGGGEPPAPVLAADDAALMALFPVVMPPRPASAASRAGHALIVLFGVTALVVSTYFTVRQIASQKH